MLFTILLQLVLPLALVALLAFVPLGRVANLVLYAGGAAAVLLALALAGVWTLLPGWLIWIYALFWLLGVVAQARTIVSWPARKKPRPFFAWTIGLVFLLLGGMGVWISAAALRGRRPSATDTVDIALPFEEGRYLVVNGGSKELINAHMKTLDSRIDRFRAFRGQSYGIDLVRVNSWGMRARGLLPSHPAEYVIYGTPVFAPCDGVVLSARSDRPDMTVPSLDQEVFEGNHVFMRCGEFDLLLAHFQQGSVAVKSGDRIRSGQQLGRVGNSGRSGEPHLHCSAQRPGTPEEPFSGDPLFLTIDGRFPVRNDRLGPAPR